MKRIGIIYNPKTQESIDFGNKLRDLIVQKKIKVWLCSAWEPDKARKDIHGSDLVISVGGDGTILRSAKAIFPEPTPLLGINLGNLGFMSEFNAEQAINNLDNVLNGEGWLEERAILEAKMLNSGKIFYALNDVFIGRRSSARLVSIVCKINNDNFTTYRADGVIVSTASGSTGYALASGGPVLSPVSKDMVLVPVCPHLSLSKTLVLPPNTTLELKLFTNHEGLISIDGQLEEQLNNGSTIEVKISANSVHFLRFQPKTYFFKTLDNKLNRKVS